MNETGESPLEVCRIGTVLFRFVTLSDVWDGRTREAGGDWGVLEGSILGGGCGEIWPLVDGEAGRHLDGNGGGRGLSRGRKEKRFWRSLPCRRALETKTGRGGVSVFAILG